MFDKIVKNNHSNRFWALTMTGALLFAYTPTAIAEPLPVTDLPAGFAALEEPLSEEDDEAPSIYEPAFVPNTITERIILEISKDYDVDPFLLKEQLYIFSDFVKHLESDNKKSATNQYSGAMSYYQFLPDSVVTAVNRLEIIMKRNGMGRVPAWASRVHKHPEEIYALSMPQQRLLMLANIMNQKGAMDLFVQLGTGDNEAAITLYYKYHHTAPDRATKNRTNQLFPKYFPKTF